MSNPNDRQVGGSHYKAEGKGEEHWDRVRRLGLDYMQAQVTKYVERAWKKNGLEDLKKAHHFLEKYISQLEEGQDKYLRDCWNESPNSSPIQDQVRERFLNDLNAVNPEHAPLASFPKGRVKPTGWLGFVFEGADAGGHLYTCKGCGAKLRVPEDIDPLVGHACTAPTP